MDNTIQLVTSFLKQNNKGFINNKWQILSMKIIQHCTILTKFPFFTCAYFPHGSHKMEEKSMSYRPDVPESRSSMPPSIDHCWVSIYYSHCLHVSPYMFPIPCPSRMLHLIPSFIFSCYLPSSATTWRWSLSLLFSVQINK